MVQDKPLPIRQPVTFWIAITGAIAGVAILAYRAVVDHEAVLLLLALIVVGAVALVIVGVSVLAVSARIASAKERLPSAVTIPILVTTSLATATSVLARDRVNKSLRLKDTSNATIAVDHTGLHFVKDATGPWGVVPVDEVQFLGHDHAVMGVRDTRGIVLRVTGQNNPVDLLLIPIRLHGNVLRSFSDAELTSIGDNVQAALIGGAGEPGWNY